MFRFVVRRLIWAVPTLLIVTFLVYVAIRIGTDPVASYLRSNQRASQAKIDEYIETNGLYEGFGGYVKGYFQWLGGFLTGDWPNSIKGNREVWPNLKDAMANTLAPGRHRVRGRDHRRDHVRRVRRAEAGFAPRRRHQHGRPGRCCRSRRSSRRSCCRWSSRVYTQEWFPSAEWLHFPAAGVYPPGQQGFDLRLMLEHLVLPVTVVAIQTIASTPATCGPRCSRRSTATTSAPPGRRGSASAGSSSSTPCATRCCRSSPSRRIDFGALFGGLIITERIFSYPGMGDYFLTAYENGDFPELMPWMVIVVVAVILFNLLADLSYATLDPRIRLD